MTSPSAPAFSLKYSIDTPGLLLGSCFDPANGNWYGAGIDNTVYRVALGAKQPEPTEQPEQSDTPAAVPLGKPHDNFISALVWRDGVIISAGYDRRVVWTRAESGEPLRGIEAHQGWVRDLILFPDAARLCTIGDDMEVRLWDASSGELLRSCSGHSLQTPESAANALYAVAASPDGRLLASADRTGRVCVWETDTGKRISDFRAPEFYTFDATKRARSIGGIRALLFLDNQRLVLGGLGPVSNVDGFVGPARFEIWDWAAPRMLHRGQDKHHAIIDHLEYVAAWETLITGGGGDAGPFLGLWKLDSELPWHKGKPKQHIHHFVVDVANTRLLAVGHGGFQMWSPAAEGPARK